MGLVTFFGAKGSPGVTTTALLAAALWPRPAVLVDADPDGGDVALRLPRADGAPLDRSLGLLTLLPLARRELAAHVVREHSQTVLGGVEVVAGLAGPEQVNAVGPLWGSLAGALHSLPDADVVVDAGRLHSQSVHLPLAQASDLVVCVLRLSVSGVVHARERLRTLDPVLVGASGRRPRVGVVIVAPAKAERDVLQVASGIQNLVPSVEMLGHLADDASGAALFAGEHGQPAGAHAAGALRTPRRHHDRGEPARARGGLGPPAGARPAAGARPLVGGLGGQGRGHRRRRPPDPEVAAQQRTSWRSGVSIDNELVRELRSRVAQRLNQQRRRDEVSGRSPMSPEDERQFARSLIVQVLEDHARGEIASGRTPLTAEEEEHTAGAIHAALFGVGRLQPLLEDPDVENIDINGCDQVFVGYADGREERHPPVADSDEELVELIQVLAANVGLTSRPFDSANPQLDLRLPDGSRLSAVMGVCARPSLSIRRSRLGKVFLSDLVGNGTMSEELASFLRAAVRARKNIMIAGATNAGKTTLLRALANEIPSIERLITVERSMELGLEHFVDLHPNVVAFEERLPNSEGAGGVSMAELVRRSLRMNPSRVIVGEVLGDEIVTMLNAMSQGNDGSLSTIHANSSMEVFNRIGTYALQAEENLPVEATHMLIAGSINFVVFVKKGNEYDSGGVLRRHVESVREVTGVDGRVLSSEVFMTPPSGGVARAHASIECLPDLVAHGYEPSTIARWA